LITEGKREKQKWTFFDDLNCPSLHYLHPLHLHHHHHHHHHQEKERKRE